MSWAHWSAELHPKGSRTNHLDISSERAWWVLQMSENHPRALRSDDMGISFHQAITYTGSAENTWKTFHQFSRTRAVMRRDGQPICLDHTWAKYDPIIWKTSPISCDTELRWLGPMRNCANKSSEQWSHSTLMGNRIAGIVSEKCTIQQSNTGWYVASLSHGNSELHQSGSRSSYLQTCFYQVWLEY